jgi:hypothetical protein
LLLAALPDNQSFFRGLSHNPLLLPDGIPGNPGALSAEELLARAWGVLEPHYVGRLERLKENFQTALARQAGSADLADIARAAVGGRVDTLLVEADRVIPGVIEQPAGTIRFGDLHSPQVDDLLDDLAELTLARGGNVVVVPRELMPSNSGVAATYRY